VVGDVFGVVHGFFFLSTDGFEGRGVFLLACWRLRFRLFLLPAFLVALEELFDTPLAVNLHDDYD
jgi:hypothetical protein